MSECPRKVDSDDPISTHLNTSSLLTLLVNQYLRNRMISNKVEIWPLVNDRAIVGRTRRASRLVPKGQRERGVDGTVRIAVVGLRIRTHSNAIPTAIEVFWAPMTLPVSDYTALIWECRGSSKRNTSYL